MPLAPDTVLQNRYRIVRKLSAGGMGTVYEAIDLRFNSQVALKETHFTEEALRKQFEREAHLLYKLRHPAIARVIDHFVEGEGQFLVMDFVEGEDLWEMLEGQRVAFPVVEVMKWADQLLDALEYLHSQDPPIIHRDIKPQNLKLTARKQIILLDFGLAKGFAGQISRVTTSGSIFGYTPNYAPLEQIQGTGTDPRSDLYSLAATLYHLLTGVIPPDALSRASANVGELPDPLKPANELNPQAAPEIADVLKRAMAQHPSRRFADANSMRAALVEASKSLMPAISELKPAVLPPTVIVPAQTQASPEEKPPAPALAETALAQESQEPGATIASGTVTSPAAGPYSAASQPIRAKRFIEPREVAPLKIKSVVAVLLVIAAIIVIMIIATIVYYSSSANSVGDAGNDSGTADSSSVTKGSKYVLTGSEGSINGKIMLTGVAPERYLIDFSQDPACAAKNPNPRTEVILVRDGNLQNVFLYIKDGQTNDGRNFRDLGFEPPANSVNLDQNGCQYVPHVLGVQPGQTLSISNSDPTTHNIHALPARGKDNEEWNEIQSRGAAPIAKTFKRSEILVPIKCNQHPWMKAYVAVVSHPFFAVSNQSGSFEIRGVPPGKYTFVAWHERFGEKTASITVTNNSSATANFSFTDNTTALLNSGSLKMMPALELPMYLH